MSEGSGLFASCLCCKGSPPEERKSKKEKRPSAVTGKQTKSKAEKHAPVESERKISETTIENQPVSSKSVQSVNGVRNESSVVRNGAAKKDSVDARDVILEEGVDADMAANLSELVGRLEKVTARLEDVASRGGGGSAGDSGRTLWFRCF